MTIMLRYGWCLALLLLSACGSNPATVKQEKNQRDAAKMNVQLASGYIQRGQLEVAQEKLLKAIEQDPDYVPGFTTMAVLKEMLGELDDAENYYLDAIDIDPKNPELQNNYGQFLCKRGKPEEAIEHLEKAAKNQFYETPEKAYANLGSCLMQGEKPDYKNAEAYLRKANKINPQMPTALLNMGELGIKTNQFLMARAYMQRYHAVSRKTAQSLWLQIQAEKALGDKKYYIELSRELIKNFPDTDEAKLVQEQSHK